MESKLWEDINEGDELPELKFGPLTVKSFFLMFAGTRDPNPQHHNSRWNKETGSRDMFATTPWHQALFARFMTDWTGPDSDFRATTLSMGAQVCPGDELIVTGKVARKYREGDDYRVLVEMTSTTEHGSSRATATMAMPSREGGEVRVLKDVAKMQVEPHPQMPDWAKPGLGNVSPKSGPQTYPISEAQIMYWCDMVECDNPLYVDSEYARDSRHKGLICPPPSLMVWTFGHPAQNPDMDNPDHEPWPPMEPWQAERRGGLVEPPGATYVLATDSLQEYGVPLRPGDRIYSTSEFVNCSPLKHTHLGWGYFMTNMTTSYNQNDEIVANSLMTLYRYGVSEEEAERLTKK